jgi:hippurate hydrolase
MPHQKNGYESALTALPDILLSATIFYLDTHRHPELSGCEERTAREFGVRLRSEGYEVTTGIGGHGVAGVLRNGDGPVVLLRAELDALPVEERTGLAYASSVTVPGPDGGRIPVMHACGHDLHLAAAAGAAALLARSADRWRGTLMVVGQPAEETLSGARAMLEDGLYTRCAAPDVVLAQHAAPFPSGLVAHGAGPLMAGSVSLEIVVHGRGGHAATAHLAVDPVLTAAAVVLRLQGVVSQETAPAEPVTLTVGSLHAGTSVNVVPECATLGLTVRGFSEAVLDRMTNAVRRIVRAECAASGCEKDPDIRVVSRSPVNAPDPSASAVVRAAHEAHFGARRVATSPPSMATEDFPLYGDAGHSLHGRSGVTSAYWMLGCAAPPPAAGPVPPERAWEHGPQPNHSPRFAPYVRTALPTGISALAVAALAHLDARRPPCGVGEHHPGSDPGPGLRG